MIIEDLQFTVRGGDFLTITWWIQRSLLLGRIKCVVT
jgi:hypothetical protein